MLRGRNANRLEHREVSQPFERGQIDHRSDDQRCDDPEQDRHDRDRTHRHLQRSEQIGDRPRSVDGPIAVGYLREGAANTDRRDKRLTAVHQLLCALRREKHVRQVGQRRGVLHDANDAQSARSDFDIVADLTFECAGHCDLVRGRRRPAFRHGGHAWPALRRAEYVNISRRITQRGRAAGVRERDRRTTPGAVAIRRKSTGAKGVAPTNGPDAPALTRNTSTPSESTVFSASTRNPFASPVRASVIAKMMLVERIAMTKRRFRHCMSRSAAISMTARLPTP